MARPPSSRKRAASKTPPAPAASPAPTPPPPQAAGQPAAPIHAASPLAPRARPSSLVDTRIIYCGDCLDQLRKLPDACIDLIYIDPPFNSNRNYEVFWGHSSEPRTPVRGPSRAFEDRHASTAAYIDTMRPRCVELTRVLKKTGSLTIRTDRVQTAPRVSAMERNDGTAKR